MVRNRCSLRNGVHVGLMLILDQKDRCGEWAKARIDTMQHIPTWGDFEAIGWEHNGELEAVVIFNFYSGADIAMHIAALPNSSWLCTEFLYAVFAYPFLQLKCRRVSGYIAAKNKTALEFSHLLGFIDNGRMPHALPDDDLIILGLLSEDCRFIRQQKAA